MQCKHLQFDQDFKIVLGDKHSQAAPMTLAPGATEDEPDIRYREADPWLFVVSREGMATFEGDQGVTLRKRWS